MKAVERFAQLMTSHSEADWCRVFFQVVSEMGFNSALLAIIPQPGMRLEEAYLRSNYAPEWRRHYDSMNLARIDPTVAHCIAHSTSLVWSPEIFRTRGQQELYEEACSFGLRSGVTLPIHGPKGELGILCFVNDARPGQSFQREVADCLPDLSLLRDIVFEAAMAFAKSPRSSEPPPSLTERERECLLWSAAGKSTWEISKILHRSESVVNYHFANIRRKFDVTTRREAIVKAMRLGMLEPGTKS